MKKATKSYFFTTPQDSRIWEIESVLFKPCAEISLKWLSHKRGAEIADSSPKAESTGARQ